MGEKKKREKKIELIGQLLKLEKELEETEKLLTEKLALLEGIQELRQKEAKLFRRLREKIFTAQEGILDAKAELVRLKAIIKENG